MPDKEQQTEPTRTIIGVMSDTHGNRTLMHRVADLMRVKFDVGLIIHVGDDYEDAQELVLYGFDVRMVPGLWCPEYQNPRIPNRVIEKIAGLTIAFAHAEKDLRHDGYASSIVMTGHTHVAQLELIGMSIHLNPGHLKSLYDRQQHASFATITVDAESVRAAIHEITGGVRKELCVSRAQLA